MRKIFLMMAAALVSLTMVAGENDLLWDYTQAQIPTTSPDRGLYFAGYVNDAPSTNNGLNGVKLNSSGWAYFEKAAVAGKLKLTFANRKAQTAYAVSVYNATKAADANPVKGTKIADTEDVEFGMSATIDLPADATGIYIERKTGAEGVLSKIEFKEDIARTFVDFKIEFRDNPYTVLLPEGGQLPAGVTVSGTTYNGGQHGVQGGTITVPVDGTIRFTLGGCQFGNGDITVKKDGQVYATISNKIDECGEQKPNYAQNVPYIYLGGTGTLTFELGSQTYMPYFFAEAAEITPCEVIYKDQTGKELGRVETYEGATLEAVPDTIVAKLPAVGEGNAMRGWFYGNGKKAKAGDPITGNTTIQAKVTPIETVTVGSVQTYDFASTIFYPEDHETVEVNNGSFHDGTHGWYFAANGDIRVQVAGNAVVVVTLCQYSESGDVMVMESEQELGKLAVVKNSTSDGTELTAKYEGNPTWLTINWTAKQYIHKVVVYNVLDFVEKDSTTGYYLVPAGDAASFLMTLVQAESGDKIFLPRGTYDLGETVLTTISKNNISIIGESMEQTIIKNAPDAKNESIDKTATIKINKNVQGTYLQDLTIQNALDYYKSDNGRAVALWDQGTKTVCKNVRLLSYQDTYYSNLQGAVKYFEDCEIHGTVDFICGDGSVYFKNNLLYCEKRAKNGGGSDALTANNGPASDKGYVFEGCTIKSECPTVSFGRAWNNKPSVAFLNTLVDYSAGNFGFESNDIQRWTKKLMNPNAWPQFGEYNTHLADGTVLTPASNIVTFLDEKSGNATQNIETVLSADSAAKFTMDYTLGEWSATAADDATQIRKNVSFEDGVLSWNPSEVGVYLVYIHSVPYCITTETSIDVTSIDWRELYEKFGMGDLMPTADYYVRFANGRGGFGPVVHAWDNPESIDNTEVRNSQTTKLIRNGQIIIVRDGKEYNVLGVEF